jgi:phage-related protein
MADGSINLDDNSKHICSEVMRLALNKNERRSYWFFTDYYLLDKMAALLNGMEQIRSKENIKGTSVYRKDMGVNDKTNLLYRYLRAFLYREKGYFRSLWKRPDEYHQFAVTALGPGSSAKTLNTKLSESYRAFARITAAAGGADTTDSDAMKRYEKEKVDYLSGEFCRSIESRVESKLQNVRVRAYYLAKFKPAPEGLKLRSVSVSGDVEEFDVDLLSPSVGALKGAWEGLPHLWLFAEYVEARRPTDAMKLSELHSAIAPILANLMDEHIQGLIA